MYRPLESSTTIFAFPVSAMYMVPSSSTKMPLGVLKDCTSSPTRYSEITLVKFHWLSRHRILLLPESAMYTPI